MNLKCFKKEIISVLEVDQTQFAKNKIKKYLQNVCSVERKVLGIVFPRSEDEVLQIILLSRKYSISLYPISKGHNYGLGSRLPVEDDHVIVDLSQMNQILYFDAELGVLQIEPGVSQEEAANYLHKINADFVLNVTGSTASSSLMGNALERGVGHYGSRVSEIINFDVILGNGDRISTGLSLPHKNRSFYSYAGGLGPDLKGLFFQSNFGIATRMTIRLLPKVQCVALITLENKSTVLLETFIDQLRLAKLRNLLPENLHISNKNRRLSVVTPLVAKDQNISMEKAAKIAHQRIQSDWAATVSLRGDRHVLEAQIKSISQFTKESANISILFDPKMNEEPDPFLRAIKGTIGHSLGIPSSDALYSLGYESGTLLNCPLEHSDIGTLFIIPVLPFRSRDFLKMVNCVIEQFKQYQFEPYMTFNLIDQINLEGVINLVFSKTDKNSSTRAHACINELTIKFEQLGYPPLRLSIFQKSTFLAEEIHKNQIKKQLKHIFDPDNIIAIGKYMLNN